MSTVWKAKEKREKLCKRQKNACHWCKAQMNRRHLDPKSATLDHIVPRSQGGSGSLDNLVAACKECNEKRGDLRQPFSGHLHRLAKDGAEVAIFHPKEKT